MPDELKFYIPPPAPLRLKMMITKQKLTHSLCRSLGLSAILLASSLLFSQSSGELRTELLQMNSTSACLSPSGRFAAYSERRDGKLFLYVSDLQTKKEQTFQIGEDIPVAGQNIDKTLRPAALTYLEFKSDSRIIFQQLFGGLWAINVDGSDRTELLKYKEVGRMDKPDTFEYSVKNVVNLLEEEPNYILVESEIIRVTSSITTLARGGRYDYYKVNITNGNAIPLSGEYGAKYRLLIDELGRICGGIDSQPDKGITEVMVSAGGKQSYVPISKAIGREFAERLGLRYAYPDSFFHRALVRGFACSPEILVFASNSGRDTYAIQLLDLKNKSLMGSMFETDQFDLSPEDLVFVSSKRELGGVRYCGVKEQATWLLAEFDKAQKGLDVMHPKTTNRIVDWNGTLDRFLVLNTSDRNPGSYSICDANGTTLCEIPNRNHTMDPKLLAPMVPLWIPTRDSRKILGYLSIAPGTKPGETKPLVVLFSDMPMQRSSWGFSSEVQLLATHGFHVLQVNVRGSRGFGFQHLSAAFGRFGDAGLEDVEDAISFLDSKKVIDKKFVFAMGTRYGGYLTLYALAKRPGLFRAGISISGVSDLIDIVDEGGQNIVAEWLPYEFKKRITLKNRSQLKLISPLYLAENINCPVLLIHGKEDLTVRAEQSRKMEKKLKNLTRTVRYVEISKTLHGFWTSEQHRLVWDEICGFLTLHQ